MRKESVPEFVRASVLGEEAERAGEEGKGTEKNEQKGIENSEK
jgi:hypothetical protein